MHILYGVIITLRSAELLKEKGLRWNGLRNLIPRGNPTRRLFDRFGFDGSALINWSPNRPPLDVVEYHMGLIVTVRAICHLKPDVVPVEVLCHVTSPIRVSSHMSAELGGIERDWKQQPLALSVPCSAPNRWWLPIGAARREPRMYLAIYWTPHFYPVFHTYVIREKVERADNTQLCLIRCQRYGFSHSCKGMATDFDCRRSRLRLRRVEIIQVKTVGLDLAFVSVGSGNFVCIVLPCALRYAPVFMLLCSWCKLKRVERVGSWKRKIRQIIVGLFKSFFVSRLQ